jgi:hypothetical protein
MVSCARASVRASPGASTARKEAFRLGIALLHPPHPFGNDLFPIAAIAATAGIDRLGDVAEADDCAIEQTLTGVIVALVLGRIAN